MNASYLSCFCRACMLRFLVVVAISVFGCHYRQSNAQGVGEQQRSASTTPDQVELRWHFEPGDLFHWQMTTHEKITDDQGKQYRNERVYDYTWFVQSVDASGVAMMEITFDRIQFRSEWLGFDFDTLNDDPMMGVAGDPEAIKLIYKLRATKASQMTLEVTSRGGIASDLVGSECVPGSVAYTPGDMPALPGPVVRVGERWSVETESSASVPELSGRAEYRITRTEQADGHLICHLEGVNKSRESSGVLVPSSIVEVTTVSRFNTGLGHFESETAESEFQTRVDTGETVSIRLDSERRLLKRGKRGETSEEPGEFLFVINGKSPKPLVLSGANVGDPSGLSRGLSKLLLLEFYHQWLDKDQDGKPGPEELSGINTRFSTDERVQFVVNTQGLQNEELYFVVVSGDAKPLFRNDIAIKGSDWFSTRKLPELEPGIYFFEFILGGEYLVRVPVQVYAALE